MRPTDIEDVQPPAPDGKVRATRSATPVGLQIAGWGIRAAVIGVVLVTVALRVLIAVLLWLMSGMH